MYLPTEFGYLTTGAVRRYASLLRLTAISVVEITTGCHRSITPVMLVADQMGEKTHGIRAEKAFEFKHTLSHPLNPDTIVPGTQLDKLVGLQRTRINVVWIPPGGEASVFHSHQIEEEWMCVLQGEGVLDIDGQDHMLGPGNFAGFPARSPPNHLKTHSARASFV